MSSVAIPPEPRYYEPYGGLVLDRVGKHILDVLREDADPLELLASTTRTAPIGDGWRPWPYVTPRVAARIGALAGTAAFLSRAAWAAWRLARRGEIQIATTPMRRSATGRIRFARALPRRNPLAVAPLWPAPFRAHAEANFA
jgi:hypothetical protein